jgi:hypothetical protein
VRPGDQSLGLGDLCEVRTGEECEGAEEVLLPDEGELLLELGEVLSLRYLDSDGQEWEHTFGPGVPLWAWARGLIINAPVSENGIEE